MWPAFHEGELAVQRRMGVDHASRRMADYVTQSTLQDPSHRFLTQRPLVAAAYTDLDGLLRLTLLWGPTGFIRILDDHKVRISPTGGVPTGLDDALEDGGRLGITALDVTRRRRAKLKGIAWSDGEHLHLSVTRTYASCPKHIQRRTLPATASPIAGCATTSVGGTHEIRAAIAATDTAFIATTHTTTGPDAAHRGGNAGFLTSDRDTLHWTEYPGNNMYNSLGNLELDRRLALLAIDFTNGTTTEISGTATVVHEPQPVVVLTPQLVEKVTHAIPGGWKSPEASTTARRRP